MISDILSNSYVLTVLLFSVLIGFGITFVVLIYFDSRVFDINGKLVPSPNSHLWGNNFYFNVIQHIKAKQISNAIHKQFLTTVGDGNIVAVNFFGSHLAIVAHPELVKVILTGHHLKFPKTDRRNRTKFIFGNGLMTSGGGRWQSHRHMLNSSFHTDSLRNMVPIFDKHSRRLVGSWNLLLSGNQRLYETEQRGIRVDFCADIRRLMLGVICQSVFGSDLRSLDLEQVMRDMEVLQQEVHLRLMDATDWSSALSVRRTEISNAATERMQSMVETVVAERIERLASTSQAEDHDVQGKTRRREDLLDLLLVSGETSLKYSGSDKTSKLESRLSPEDLRDHLMTFLMAGYETTASTLMWILHELSLHPTEQTLCHEEVDSVLFAKQAGGAAQLDSQTRYRDDNSLTGDGGVLLEDIARFEYLMQVVKETLRLHPTVPTIARRSAQECMLGEYQLKANSTVLINTMALHRHPDYWVRADEFDPDRFSRENQRITIQHPFQYVPFSAGPRNCIGQRFAQMAMIVILANLLSQYSFSPVEDASQPFRFEETGGVNHPVNLFMLVSRREKANVSGNVC